MIHAIAISVYLGPILCLVVYKAIMNGLGHPDDMWMSNDWFAGLVVWPLLMPLGLLWVAFWWVPLSIAKRCRPVKIPVAKVIK